VNFVDNHLLDLTANGFAVPYAANMQESRQSQQKEYVLSVVPPSGVMGDSDIVARRVNNKCTMNQRIKGVASHK